MRPGERPLAELSRTLARAVPEAGAEDGAPWVADALERLPAGERLVLAVDQFEEVFVACRDAAEREAFLDALVEGAADPDERLVVVLAIRADFYGRCAEHAELSTLVSANQVLVGPMRRDELRRAIELPGAPGRAAGRAAAGLGAGRRRRRRARRPAAALRRPARALAGAQRPHPAATRTTSAPAASSGAVARLAEDAYQRLGADERAGRGRCCCDSPATTRGPRRSSAAASPLDELELERDEDAARALAVLTESRLLTVDEGAVEVAHEALLREWPRLRGWLEADAEGRRLHQHLIALPREWRDSGRDPAELYRGARLAAALDWAAEHDPELNELEREFLEASRVASEREAERQRRTNRRLRTLLAGVGVLLTAAVVAGVIAVSERQGARSAATVADAERLGAEALNEDRLDRRAAARQRRRRPRRLGRDPLEPALDPLRSPAALGVLNVGGEPTRAPSAPTDGRSRSARTGRDRAAVRHRDARADRRVTMRRARRGRSASIPGRVTRDRRRRRRRRSSRDTSHVLDADTAQVRSSVALGRHPAAPGAAVLPHGELRPGRAEPGRRPTPAATSTGRCRCSCAGTTPAAPRRSARPSASPTARSASGR